MGQGQQLLMHIVSHRAIRIFHEEYPLARAALGHWSHVAKQATLAGFAEVK